jgi:hypothetical protein
MTDGYAESWTLADDFLQFCDLSVAIGEGDG